MGPPRLAVVVVLVAMSLFSPKPIFELVGDELHFTDGLDDAWSPPSSPSSRSPVEAGSGSGGGDGGGSGSGGGAAGDEALRGDPGSLVSTPGSSGWHAHPRSKRRVKKYKLDDVVALRFDFDQEDVNTYFLNVTIVTRRCVRVCVSVCVCAAAPS